MNKIIPKLYIIQSLQTSNYNNYSMINEQTYSQITPNIIYYLSTNAEHLIRKCCDYFNILMP
ncbi:hypothetical protein H8356DRAFT_1362112 [Neocallimastix lanati (nom. inval.)]|nr:hypothetical protein H8356DRAFT_1362112 [Neocallimastix sp. JGI-2020a]